MSDRLYGTSGTLVGAPVLVDIQVATNWTASYVEVHNLHASNTYSCAVNGATFSIPAGRKLSIPGQIPNITLNGTGAYSVYAAESADKLPSLDNISQGSIGSSGAISPFDNVTLEDTGVVSQVKDLGISTAKLADLSVTTGKLADDAVTSLKLAPASVNTINLISSAVTYPKLGVGSVGDPGDCSSVYFNDTGIGPGQTLALTYNSTTVTYEFNFIDPVNANVHVDLAGMPNSLANAIMANQAPLIAFAGGTNTWIGAPNNGNTQSGLAITGVASAGTFQTVVSAAPTNYRGVEHSRVTLTALTAANGFAVFSPGTIQGYHLTLTRAAGTIFSNVGCSAFVSGGGKALYVSAFPAGAMAGDFVDVTLFVQY